MVYGQIDVGLRGAAVDGELALLLAAVVLLVGSPGDPTAPGLAVLPHGHMLKGAPPAPDPEQTCPCDPNQLEMPEDI